jgi:hypothetical protein
LIGPDLLAQGGVELNDGSVAVGEQPVAGGIGLADRERAQTGPGGPGGELGLGQLGLGDHQLVLGREAGLDHALELLDGRLLGLDAQACRRGLALHQRQLTSLDAHELVARFHAIAHPYDELGDAARQRRVARRAQRLEREHATCHRRTLERRPEFGDAGLELDLCRMIERNGVVVDSPGISRRTLDRPATRRREEKQEGDTNGHSGASDVGASARSNSIRARYAAA